MYTSWGCGYYLGGGGGGGNRGDWESASDSHNSFQNRHSTTDGFMLKFILTMNEKRIIFIQSGELAERSHDVTATQKPIHQHYQDIDRLQL